MTAVPEKWPEVASDPAIRRRALEIAKTTHGGKNVERIAASLVNVARAVGRERAGEALADCAHANILEPILFVFNETRTTGRRGVDVHLGGFLRGFRGEILKVLHWMRVAEWEGIDSAIRLACSQHPRSRKTLEAPGSLPAPARRGRA